MVVLVDDGDAAVRTAAEVITSAIRADPRLRLGLAAGTTPLPLYHDLIRLAREQGVDYSQLTIFSLDEYLDLPPQHPSRFGSFLRRHFLDQVNVAESGLRLLDAAGLDDGERTCGAYEAAIREAGGIDLQLLGIGRNGHLGFNEPGSSLASRTRPVALTSDTIDANRHLFPDGEAPQLAVTMGLGTILEAKRLVLLAFGETKSQAIAAALEGPITASVPASVLQLHPDVLVFLDEAAAAHLTRREYYRRAAALWKRSVRGSRGSENVRSSRFEVRS